jgi:hypothetical protein
LTVGFYPTWPATRLFVATGDGSVNADVAADARAHGVWVNAVDDPAH